MTPFRNDEANPFGRPSVWPKMPQSPMSLGALPRAFAPAPTPPAEPMPPPEPAPRAQVQVVEAEVVIAAAEAEIAIPEPPPAPEPLPALQLDPQPIAAPIAMRRRAPARQPLRLTPLIAAAAVGAGGMAALFLIMGVRPALAPSPAPVPARRALAVGEMVGGPAAPAPTPLASTPAVAPSPVPRLAMVRSVPRHAALTTQTPSPAAPPINVPAVQSTPAGGGSRSERGRVASDPGTEPAPITLQPSPPQPAASLAAPAEPPAAPPYKPPAAPDRNAPIATHVPD